MRFFNNIVGVALTLCIYASTVEAKNCDEQKVLAMNIYHEARAESLEGKLMVAEVVFNRMDSNKFPDTVCDVVYDKGQFEWVAKKLPINDTETFQEIYFLSGEILEGEVELPNTEALFFKSKNVKSSFHSKRKFLGAVGNHEFYK